MTDRIDYISKKDIRGISVIRDFCGYKRDAAGQSSSTTSQHNRWRDLIDAYCDEEWRFVEGLDNKVMVSNLGRVAKWNRMSGFRIIHQQKDSNGYMKVDIYSAGGRRSQSVHRLVAETFIDGKTDERNQVNHKNLDKTDNRVKNLEWVTPRENVHHYLRSVGKAIA